MIVVVKAPVILVKAKLKKIVIQLNGCTYQKEAVKKSAAVALCQAMKNRNVTTICGAGVGLRACHYQAILQHKPSIPWFEALTDNYLIGGGAALHYLRAIRQHYPMTLHGVGLSLGASDPLNHAYLTKLKALIADIQPAFVSDHLCWTGTQQQYLHELLPLPYSKEALEHVVSRIDQVQNILGRTILIENVSSYFEFKHNEMLESEFINEVSQQSGCSILLDINNIYVNAYNHGYDARQYLQHINPETVKQFHLAGYADNKRFLFDSHGSPIHQPVWELYQAALQRFGAVPTLIEWDDNIPALAVLQQEAQKAETLMQQALATTSC